ncbi:hypothetical protein SAMN05216499_1418 [Actinacidiphila paucisporea]|uniref:Uncharacterized protein n=1 Tax=Actinacidiphila paucisporea TaxID=310782 RepID=A0A1M7QRU5_9ACTN|nr:hypothetical protein SAMN05216499_1418 [Actinacidiphila paucisporea]
MTTSLRVLRRGVAATALSVALAACAGILSPAAAAVAPAAPSAVRAAGQTITLPVRDALAQLPVAAEDRTGY